MNEQASRSEDPTLLISGGGNLLIAIVGVLCAAFSSSQAILLDAVREETLHGLRNAHEGTVLDMEFTADPFWGAPPGSNT